MYIIIAMESIQVKAWAKINLTLDVRGKRPDGYHELASVMQALCLHDTLVLRKTTEALRLTTNSPELPTDEGNLVYRAAALLRETYGIRQGLEIHLHKNIPIAAGLAGGSSNCAAVLRGLNTLLDLRIPFERLAEIGRSLGADVPFCLWAGEESASGTALAEGIGERLTPLPPHPDVWMVLARLPIWVSTQAVFAYFETAPSAESASAEMAEALHCGDVARIAAGLDNQLYATAAALHPEIPALLDALRATNALGVSMSGSGPTVFAYYSEKTCAQAALADIQTQFPGCAGFLTRPHSEFKRG